MPQIMETEALQARFQSKLRQVDLQPFIGVVGSNFSRIRKQEKCSDEARQTRASQPVHAAQTR